MHLGEFLPPLVASAVYMLAYGIRSRTLARQGRPVPVWRVAAFAAGVLLVTAAQSPPLDGIADELLIEHMVQHLVIGDLASFLVVIGLTGPLMQPLLRIRLRRWLRPLTHPVAALGLWGLNYYVWHAPFLYQAALRHDLVHALEHASYFWFGVLLWVALLRPLPKPRWFGNWAALANAFIWAGTVFYTYYDGRDVRFGLNPLNDQNVAGAIMMIEQIILTTLLLAWLFARAAREDEERQGLIDLAERRGYALSDERAARAAASGTTARLRERLLDSTRDRRPTRGSSGSRE